QEIERIDVIGADVDGLEVGLAEEIQNRINQVNSVNAQLNAKIDALNTELNEILGAEEYSANTSYLHGTLIKHDGSMWRAKQNVPAGNPPPNETYWLKVGDYESIGELVAAHSANIADLQLRVEQNEDDISASASAINTLVSAVQSAEQGIIDNTAAIQQESQTRADADQALASQINTVSASAQSAQQSADNAMAAAEDAQEDADLAK